MLGMYKRCRLLQTLHCNWFLETATLGDWTWIDPSLSTWLLSKGHRNTRSVTRQVQSGRAGGLAPVDPKSFDLGGEGQVQGGRSDLPLAAGVSWEGVLITESQNTVKGGLVTATS